MPLNASDKTDRISRRLLPSLNPSEIIIKAAHHETGHAIVEMKIPQSRRVLSIVLLEDEAYVNLKTRKIVQENSRENIICEIACWLAGLTNEKLHLGSMVKKHALEDIYKAVSLAYSAVNNFSPKDVKKITYEDASNYARSIDLEKDSFSCFQISPNDSEAVIRQKSEILKALDAGWKMAKKFSRKNMSASEEIAKTCLKKRILMGEEFEALLEKTSPR